MGADTWAKLAPFEAGNFGVGQHCTEHTLWNLTNGSLVGFDPAVVVLPIGTNNLGNQRGDKPEWVAAGIKKIIDLTLKQKPVSKIVLMALFPRDTAVSEMRKKMGETNALIEKFADGKRVVMLDIGNKFLDGQGEARKELLHPGRAGYKIWYDAVTPLAESKK